MCFYFNGFNFILLLLFNLLFKQINNNEQQISISKYSCHAQIGGYQPLGGGDREMGDKE